MKCQNGCGKNMTLLHRVMVDGVKKYVCTNCKIIMQRIQNDIDEQTKEHENSYVLKWKLRNQETGEIWIEEHNEMDLNDIEIVYGNNLYEIMWMILRQKDVAVI